MQKKKIGGLAINWYKVTQAVVGLFLLVNSFNQSENKVPRNQDY